MWKDPEGKKGEGGSGVVDLREQEQRTQLTPDTPVPSSKRQAVLAEVLMDTAHVTGAPPGQ